MITRKGWVTLLSSLVALAVATLALNYLVLLVAVTVFAFVATDVIGFHFAVPRLTPDLFAVEREPLPNRVAVPSDVGVRLRVTYYGAKGFWAQVHDVTPAGMTRILGRKAVVQYLGPGSTAVLDFVGRVEERGTHRLGPTMVLAIGPLGLSYTYVTLSTEVDLLAVPSSPMRRPGPALRALSSPIQGHAVLRQRGFGSEVRSLREYQETDDIRTIAWRRSTLDHLIVREFEQESRQEYVLVFDETPAMGAGFPGTTALDVGAGGAWLLAGLVDRGGEDRIGFLRTPEGTCEFLPPGRGRRHLSHVQEQLARIEPGPNSFDLTGVLDFLTSRLKVHTHVFTFTATPIVARRFLPAYRRFLHHGHRLYVFTPEISRLFPLLTGSHFAAADRWARRTENERLEHRLRLFRLNGVPAFSFHARNVTFRVASTYGQVRAWGRAA